MTNWYCQECRKFMVKSYKELRPKLQRRLRAFNTLLCDDCETEDYWREEE